MKHKLAETMVATRICRCSDRGGRNHRRHNCRICRQALAGRAADMSARNCLQVFGGIGFTAEHQFQRYFRRGLVLDQLLGDSRAIEEELGRQLREGEIGRNRVVDPYDYPRLDLLPAHD